jgi:hypothetical protein
MRKLPLILLCVALLTGLTAATVYAQSTGQLQLGLSRDFGYGGFGNDIQGLFTIKVNNPPADLAKVEFYIDTTLMGEDIQAPFNLQFNTDSYTLGVHKLSAIGYLTDGAQISSNVIQVQFVPAGAATGTVLKIVVPIVGLVVLVIVISYALPLILNKGKLSTVPPGTQRNYGIGGGAICPKCGRPFPLRMWFINMGPGKLDRCPYCGKWSYVHRSSLAELRAAEQAELAQAEPTDTTKRETEAEKLKKELDDSRFQDM